MTSILDINIERTKGTISNLAYFIAIIKFLFFIFLNNIRYDSSKNQSSKCINAFQYITDIYYVYNLKLPFQFKANMLSNTNTRGLKTYAKDLRSALTWSSLLFIFAYRYALPAKTARSAQHDTPLYHP